MFIYGVYCNPVVVVAWSAFAGLLVGYVWGRFSGIREGIAKLKKRMEQQTARNAYIQAVQEMMRRMQ